MGKEKKWYAIYSKPRWEKKVQALLTENGVTAYCPLNRVKKKWSDRIKWVEEPLFTSYVFVHISEVEKLIVRKTSGVLNFVYYNGKPAIIKSIEIERIKKLLDEYDNIELSSEKIQKNQRVIVNNGPFVEQAGRVIDLKNNKVKVEIASLGYTLVAVFDKSELISG